MFSRRLVLLGAIVVLATASPAAAHGDIQGTDPAPEATVRRAPRAIAVTFTEAPTAQAILEVADGCKRNVGQGVEVSDATATVRVATGQPGRWRVSYRVISSLDGHQTRGGYTFTVAGKRDCTPDEKPTGRPDDDPTQAARGNDEDGTDEEGGDSGAPVVPIALGAAGLIVVALILRRAGSG